LSPPPVGGLVTQLSTIFVLTVTTRVTYNGSRSFVPTLRSGQADSSTHQWIVGKIISFRLGGTRGAELTLHIFSKGCSAPFKFVAKVF